MSHQSFNPAAKNSQVSLPSGDSPPSCQNPAAANAAVTFTKKQLFSPHKLDSLTPLAFNLSAASLHLHSALSLRPFHPQTKLKLRNHKNPTLPFYGMFTNAFKGFTHHFSNLLSKTPLPLLAGKLRRRNSWSQLLCPHAIAKENNQSQSWDSHNLQTNLVVQLNKLSAFKTYKVSAIKFLNPRNRSVVASAAETFGDILELPRAGGVYTKQELAERLEYLSSSGFFEKVDFDAQTNPDGSIDINIPFREKLYPSKTKFTCISVDGLPELKPVEMDPNMTWREQPEAMRKMNEQYRRRVESAAGCILPGAVQREIEAMMVKRPSFSGSLLKQITDKVMKWYRNNGYDAARVVSTSNPELNPGGEITFEMMEGKIEKLGVKYVDKMGNRVVGDTNAGVIKRALSNVVAVGKAFNQRGLEKAMLNIGTLGIFSHSDVNLNQDEKSGGVSAEFVLQEQQRKWCELETKWNMAPGHNLLSSLLSATPGATISMGLRNIKGLNRSLQGAFNFSNLLDPQADDIGFNVEYKHPYLDGVENPRNRTLNVVCFNSRKPSPVFRGAAGEEDAPIWVDRVGAKATITEDLSRQSRFTYGLVMEDIKTRGEGGEVVGRAATAAAGNGPPTTLSGTGVDHMAFLQANITRDNTRFVNGVIVGDRNVFQVDQGLGIGIKSPLFNRFKLWGTKFIPLKRVDESKGEAPPVLVVHGLLGGYVGDLPNHESFTIGGPHSVRGYDIGEIGASRHKLEVATEVRLPVVGVGERYIGVKDAYVYAFGEHGNDLGSSVSVKGNPTNSYRRKGYGSSYGGGIKLANLRLEYAVDHNSTDGFFSLHFGDRF